MAVRRVLLSPGDVAHAATAYAYLLRAGWRLFVRRDSTLPWLRLGDVSGLAGPTPIEAPVYARAERAALWVNRAARRPWPWARCLQRSVATCLWLERLGYQPDLRIGVRKDGDKLDAHAWVLCDGRIINDVGTVESDFAALKGAASRQSAPHREREGHRP